LFFDLFKFIIFFYKMEEEIKLILYEAINKIVEPVIIDPDNNEKGEIIIPKIEPVKKKRGRKPKSPSEKPLKRAKPGRPPKSPSEKPPKRTKLGRPPKNEEKPKIEAPAENVIRSDSLIVPDSPPSDLQDTMVELFRTQHSENSFRLHNPKTKHIPEEETTALEKGTHHLVKRECWGSRKKRLINVEELLYPYVSIFQIYGDVISKEEFQEMQTQRKEDYEYCVKIQRIDQTNTNTITSYLKISRHDEHSRILNHSCQPNCCIIEQEVPHRFRPGEKEIQYILHAMKKIDFFEELTIDYGWYANTVRDLHVCDCETSNCKKTIHKNGQMFTRKGIQYVKLEDQDAVVWPKYMSLPLNHSVGRRVWEFLDDLDLTDLNFIRARSEYLKNNKPDDPKIMQTHRALIRQGLKNAGLQKMPTKNRGRPENIRLMSYGCYGNYSDGLDDWGYEANGRPLKNILYYIEKQESDQWHCIKMQRDEKGTLFNNDGSRSGHIFICKG